MTQSAKPIGLSVARALTVAILVALIGISASSGLHLVQAQDNNPATGEPVIIGAAQLDEILRVRTIGIDDDDGLTNPGFSYQWIRRDGTTDTEIDGETGSSYTIVAADVGKTIKVEVSFKDDENNTETLTSAPTATVSGTRNSPTTGTPAISGTAQVGQTVTVNTSGIDDDDGLTNVQYGATWTAGGYSRAFIAAGRDLSYRVSRRDVGLALEVSVNFRDDAGKSVFLDSAPTPAVVPTSPAALENFSVSQDSDGDLDLSWQAPEWDLAGEIGGDGTWGDGGSPITGYVVQWKKSEDSWNTVADVSEATETGMSHSIEGLTDEEEYSIRVLAVNAVGGGIPSSEATVTIDRPGSPPGGTPPSGDPPSPTSDSCTSELGTLAGTTSRNGSWTDDCESEVSGRGYARYYSFTLSAEAEATIDLTSSVDTYLYLREGSATSGTALHSNDDIESGNTDSRIVETLAAGTWTIEATTYSEDTAGSFTLSVSGGGSQTPVATGCDAAALTLPASGVSGSWTEDCESEVSGRGYARYYSCTLGESAEVTIDLTSSVDTYLYLREGSATSGTDLHSNDDIESGNTDSRIVETLAAGSYTIEATTYNEDTTGSFAISVSGENSS